MSEVWISMAISLVLLAIKDSVKNPARKADLRKAFLKIYNAIKDLYAGDPEFK